MKIEKTDLLDVYLITPNVFEDDRGWFMESYAFNTLSQAGLNITFVQDNHSLSKSKGTLRGLHYQTYPKAQTKLVRCTRGSIFDVAIDLRPESRTYLNWIGIELTAKNHKQLLVPKGFAHGFLTLEDNTEVAYKVDEHYDVNSDRSILWNDETLKINWPIIDPLVSEKDKKAPTYKSIDPYTIYPKGDESL